MLPSLRVLVLSASVTTLVGCGGSGECVDGAGPFPAGAEVVGVRDAGPVLARVGEAGGVTEREFSEAASRTPPADGRNLGPDERREVLEQLIVDEALFQEAARRGLHRDPRIRRSLINLLMKEEVASRVESTLFTTEELRAYFEANKDDFAVAENIQVKRIFLRAGDKRSLEAAMAQASELRQRIVTDPDSFKDLAVQHSEDPFARRGGDLGYLTREGKPGIDPKVLDVAFTLEAGEVSEPFEAGGGVNLVYVARKRPRVERSFEHTQGSVLRKLKYERHRELSDAYVKQVREQARVTIDEAALARAPAEPVRARVLDRPPLPGLDLEAEIDAVEEEASH